MIHRDKALLAAAAVVAFCVPVWLGLGLIRSSAPTYDEPVHLAVGYHRLLGGSARVYNAWHPPLGEMWAAVPLLALAPQRSVPAGGIYDFADLFLYKNRVRADAMLDAARLWCLASWTAIMGAAVLAWAWRLAGPAGAAWAAWLFAFCVPLFSNAALVTTDASSAAFFFLVFFILSGGARRPWRWAAAGACAGLAMASKYTLFIVLPFAAGALFVEGRRESPRPGPAAYAALGAGALLALAAVFRFRLSDYWEGLSYTFKLLDQGRSSFFFGRHSTEGHALYFPAAFAVKTPLALLAAGAIGLALALRAPSLPLFWAAAPPAAYFLAACASKVQIGYRHLLPVYPFLIVLAAWGLSRLGERRWGRAAGLALAAWLAASVLRVHPHHLAYFNELAGGPERGHERLVDSNLDWGQGLKELGAELIRRGSPAVVLSYFGSADPSFYGVRYEPLGFISNVARREGTARRAPGAPLLLAVSATNLRATYYADKQAFSWLDGKTPVFSAGHSLFLYDLSSDPGAAAKLADMLR